MSESEKQPSELVELTEDELPVVVAEPEPITDEKLNQISDELGMIKTCFPENPTPYFEGRTQFPESYYTLNAKERLLLVFAENFRRQFKEKYPHRRPVVLVIRNECNVQKFVSTTIRPTAFLYPELIGSWQGCASFVADHIVYEPLTNPLVLPNRLLSPETILNRRKANCFEFATLLCSFLTGTGYAACVVAGSATREVCLNDLSYQDCPIQVGGDCDDSTAPVRTPKKYDLKSPVDLRSRYEVELANKRADKVLQAQLRVEAEERARIEDEEKPPPDEYRGHRVHAWVVVIERAPWSYKPEYRQHGVQRLSGENQSEPKPTVFFIEPATGLRFEPTDTSYLRIDSIWNQHNYYVNCQTDVGIADMEWDLRDTAKWEHLLPGEPLEMRVDRALDTDQEQLTDAEELEKEKHLEMPMSWVSHLDVSLPVFEERFPGGHKTVHYKKSVLDVYAPYINTSGLWRELTLFSTVAYEKPLQRHKWFKNRQDNLVQVRTDFAKLQKHQFFAKGRPDALKKYTYVLNDRLNYSLEFFNEPRSDALKKIEVSATIMQETYAQRDDLEFGFTSRHDDGENSKILKYIVEKFDRNPKVCANEDIYIRHFCLDENRILLQFHYGDDHIVPYIREFKKPSKTKLPDDTMFDPSSTSLQPIDIDYKLQERFVKAMRGLYQAEHNNVVAKDSVEQLMADESDGEETILIEMKEKHVKGYHAHQEPTQLELYLLKNQQLKAETKAVAAFVSRCEEIDKLIDLRRSEMESPQLRISMFDPLRNGDARRARMERYAQIKAREELAKTQLPDYLAPYLCRSNSEALTAAEAKAAFEECLRNLAANYSDLEQELQRRHDESVAEGEALMRFLQRFQDKLNDVDYQSFIVEGENIERNTRVLAQRIANTKLDATRKYGALKDSLLQDARLPPHRAHLLDNSN